MLVVRDTPEIVVEVAPVTAAVTTKLDEETFLKFKMNARQRTVPPVVHVTEIVLVLSVPAANL